MSYSAKIDFVEAPSTITQAVTKFGGQPVWLEAPQLPTSRLTGQPMYFIAQIVIPKDWYSQDTANSELRLAYIFMTGAGFDDHASNTSDPNDGETAVIIQAGSKDHVSIAGYPKLLEKSDWATGDRHIRECEYAVQETAHTEPEYQTQDALLDLTEHEQDAYQAAAAGNKIGGNPDWVQSEDIPFEPWHLLLQLEDGSYPFDLNLGTGIGYVFINQRCSEGAFSWQC